MTVMTALTLNSRHDEGRNDPGTGDGDVRNREEEPILSNMRRGLEC